MNKIRKGDEVVVLTGRDKKRRGTVLARLDADHVLVEGINMVKKHVRPNPMQGTTGGIIEKTMPIHISILHCLIPPPVKVIALGFKKLTVAKFVFFVPAANPLARKLKGR